MKELYYFLKYFAHYSRISMGVISTLLFLILLSGVLFSYVENISISDAIYFIFITALTIGYGDIAPSTSGAKIICVFVGLVGMMLFGLIVAIASLSLKSAIKKLNLE